MRKFEHKITTLPIREFSSWEKKLQELGNGGWELVAVLDNRNGDVRAFLKREV